MFKEDLVPTCSQKRHQENHLKLRHTEINTKGHTKDKFDRQKNVRIQEIRITEAAKGCLNAAQRT